MICKNETALVSFASFQNEKFLEIKSPQCISFQERTVDGFPHLTRCA
ncbi:MAG: hypothetical protein OJF50_002532 [Nitrospira sp.]|nr:hypothetical protein [Nitrospira sp.]